MVVEEESPISATTITSIEEDDLPPVNCTAVSSQVPRGDIKIVKGTLNNKEVTVLLDGGADSIFVSRRLVSPDVYTGQTFQTRTATQLITGCPAARINFSCPYYEGGDTSGIVLDNLAYDVILGRVRGTSPFDEEPPRDLRPPLQPELQIKVDPHCVQDKDVSPTSENEENQGVDVVDCHVTTRSQQRTTPVVETTPVADESIVSTPLPVKPLPSALEFGQAQKDCPSLKKLRQQARSRAEIYERGGALSRIKEEGGVFTRVYLKDGIQQEQLLVPTQFRKEVLQLAHENPLSGHFGIDKTKERIWREFYWPQLEQDVKAFILQCTTCNMMQPRRPAKVPLGTPALATEPFSAVSIDLVGPLSPVSSEGHRYILTMVDQATRYPDALPLRRIDSQTVAEALVKMFSSVGYPKQLTSDNGTQFTSSMFEAFLKLIGTRHLQTPVYHAQSNGLVERFNGTLKNVLRKLTSDRPRDWHRHLPTLLFSYRDAPHSSTGFSPFELVFGHRVRGPLSFLRECWSSTEDPNDEEREIHQYISDLKDRLKSACAMARDNLNTKQSQYKRQFDKKTRMRTLRAGDQVVIFLPTSPKKLLMKWRGPYKVLSRLGSYTYKVDVPGTHKVYHINLLKRYTPEVATEEMSLSQEEERVDDPEPSQETRASTHVLNSEDEVYAAIAVACEMPDDHNMDDKDPSLPQDTEETFRDCALGPTLAPQQQDEIQLLLRKHQDTLSSVPGLTQSIEHKLTIKDNETFRLQHSYPLPLALEDTLRLELEKWLNMGIIEHSDSPYCSPLLAVRKKDGTHRFCLDCRQLNAQTIHDQEPISDPNYIFANLAEAKWFTKVDLTSGYWQVPLDIDSRPYTAFRTRHGLYQFKVMPFGLVNAPATFSRLMRRVTKDLPNTFCYLDDVLIATKDWESHLTALDRLFTSLQAHGLKAKPSKCEIGCQQLTYLGHIIGAGVSKPLPDRVEAITIAEVPKTKAELRSFLGSVGYYQRFIKRYSELTQPLSDLLKKNRPEIIQWSDTTLDILESLQKVLSKAPVLQLPDLNQPFTLQTDASGTGIAAVLLQPNSIDSRILSPVAFASRQLRNAELNYSAIEKEGLAVYWALQKFHIYLYGRDFTLRTDHKPLLYLGQSDKLNPRLKRWAIYIGLYRFTAEHVRGVDNCLPDFLSRTSPESTRRSGE